VLQWDAMHTESRTIRRDVWWFVLPVLFLAGLGLALRNIKPKSEVGYEGLSLVKTQVVKYSPQQVKARLGEDTCVSVMLRYHGREPVSVWKYRTLHIVDEKGRLYPNFRFGKSGIPREGIRRQDPSFGGLPVGKDGIVTIRFFFPVSEIPVSAGKLTFKTAIAVNESPHYLPLSVVVRRGKVDNGHG
jgi:hypothetical protein